MTQAYLTSAEIEANHPELAGKVTDFAVELGQQFVDLKACGLKASFMHDLVVAHIVASAPGSGVAGGQTVSSKSFGSMSISYAIPTTDSEWQTTPYGSQYLQLRNSMISLRLLFGFRCR